MYQAPELWKIKFKQKSKAPRSLGKKEGKKQHGASVEDMLWVSEVAVDQQSRNFTGVSQARLKYWIKPFVQLSGCTGKGVFVKQNDYYAGREVK